MLGGALSGVDRNIREQEELKQYPVLTVRWAAVHALTIPTVFFLGSIVAMQFI